MEHNEQGERNGAAKEFQKSLDHLQNLLEEDATEEKQAPKVEVENIPEQPADEESPKFDLADWEDAVADIEQYFENKEKGN